MLSDPSCPLFGLKVFQTRAKHETEVPCPGPWPYPQPPTEFATFCRVGIGPSEHEKRVVRERLRDRLVRATGASPRYGVRGRARRRVADDVRRAGGRREDRTLAPIER